MVAAISGLADMDAIAISTLQLFTGGQITAAQACHAIVIALASNMAFKATLVLVLAGRDLAWRVGVSYLSVLAGLAAGVLLLAR